MKKLLCLLMAVVMLFSFAGCGNNNGGNDEADVSEQTTDSSSTSDSDTTNDSNAVSDYDVLNVGVLVSTCGIPALYAQDQGWFEEAGLNVDISIFATGAPVNEAIAAGELDIACSGFASVYSLANADCRWLLDINSTGGMGIFARDDSTVVAAGNTLPDNPDILGSAETVKGLQILGPLGTAVQYMVEGYAEKFGLAPDEVNMVNMEYAPAYQAFVAGEADLNATNPPTSYTMDEEGYIKVCSFEDATGVSLMDGCFARGEIVDNRAEEVQLFVDILVRAMDELQDEDLRFDYTMEKFTENAQEFTEDTLKREIEDRDYYGTALVTDADYVFGEAWGAITDFLVEAEKIVPENAPNVVASFDPSFLESAVDATIVKYEG